MWLLYDYIDEHGANIIAEWIRRLQAPQRKKLQAKLNLLMQSGPDLPPQLLAGPVFDHIYKLKVQGNVKLRPMLCKGPLNNDKEFTMLIGAIEKDYKLDPANAAEVAAKNRLAIIKNHTRRCPHERIT